MLLNKFRVLIPIILISGFSAAQQQPRDTIKPMAIDEVMITATRNVRRLSSLPLPGAVIDSATIAAVGATRLNEVLGEQTGLITVPDFGGGEGLQMQGMDSAYTMILVDGVPLVGRSAGTMDLARITVGNIDRIEVVKGASSALYGSEALAGVVNIITRKPNREGIDGNASYRFGSLNTHDGNFNLNGKRKKLAASVFGNYYQTDGYSLSRTAAANGQTVAPHNSFTANPKAYYTFSENVKLNTSFRYFRQGQDNNSTIENIYYTGNAHIDEWNAYARLDHKWSDRYRTEYEMYTTNYQTHSNLDDPNGVRYSSDFYDQWLIRPEVRSILQLGNGTLTSGTGYIHESLERTSFDNIASFNSGYLYTQYEYNPGGKLNVIGGLRYDAHSAYRSQLSPKLAIAYKPADAVVIKGSMGYGYKAPDFRQLYFDFNNAAVGYTVLGYNVALENLIRMRDEGIITTWDQSVNFNDPLKPESSINFNLGANYKRRKFILDTNLFYNKISNLIDTKVVAAKLDSEGVQNNSIFSYYNVNKVNTYGLELNLQYRLTNDLKVTGGYQYLVAKDPSVVDEIKASGQKSIVRDPQTLENFRIKTSDYFGLPNRSRHTANIKVYYTVPEWKTDIAVRVIYRSEYGLNDTNSNGIIDKYDNLVKGYTMANISVGQPFLKKFYVQGGANNIFDFTNATQISNIPGRLLFIKLNYNF
ncbi:MAG: TonB-dependent receptor plug domain-containing protein [Bacteroidia bacterium]